MTEIETKLVDILKQFGGESSMFLITNPDSPWGALGDKAALEAAVKSLAAQGVLVHDTANDVVKVA